MAIPNFEVQTLHWCATICKRLSVSTDAKYLNADCSFALPSIHQNDVKSTETVKTVVAGDVNENTVVVNSIWCAPYSAGVKEPAEKIL